MFSSSHLPYFGFPGTYWMQVTDACMSNESSEFPETRKGSWRQEYRGTQEKSEY